MKHASEREAYFRHIKLELDKQNKDVIDKHNYEKGKSLFEYPDRERLIAKFVGKGKSINKEIPGNSNYRE